MSETAAFVALIETASTVGVESRIRYLKEYGPHEMGWSYANIRDMAPILRRQLVKKGYFRVYLSIPELDFDIRYSLKITSVKTFPRPEVFTDPVDGRRYLVHSRMMIRSIDEIVPPRKLSGFLSIDRRKPDVRHLALGFLFVVDPEV
jgi:hypothetical protein